MVCRRKTLCLSTVAGCTASLLSLVVADTAVARPTLDPAAYEQHGPIAVKRTTRQVARALQAPQATVHHRPPPRAYSTRDLKDMQALTAPLDRDRDAPTTPQPAPAGMNMPDLAIAWNAKSQAYLEHYTQTKVGQSRMRTWLERLRLYGPSLQKILVAHGVPRDLIYVAMVESGLHAGRRSRVGASGTWQFMPASGEAYGLHQSRWVDDRNHVIKSTHAAALYLSDLHARFGNWALALAAYNAGYGLLLKTMQRHNTNNFWALRNIESGLPVSTANYTPKVLALAVVGNNASSLGLQQPDVEPWDLIEIPAPPRRRLNDLAKHAGLDASRLRELNAHLIRGVTPPSSEPTTLVIPRAWKPAMQRAIGAPHAELILHRLRSGERLEDVADLSDLQLRDLLDLNGGQRSSFFRTGDQIIVPKPIDLATYPAFPQQAIAVHALTPKPQHRTLLVRVHSNTGARELERTFHCDWSDIVADNGLDPSARFFNGQTLLIQVPEDQLPDQTRALYLMVDESALPLFLRGSERYIDAELRSRGLVRRAYQVHPGDTMERVAQRYASTAGSLGRINAMHPQTLLRGGQSLIVYTPHWATGGTVAPPPPARIPAQTPTRLR